MPTPMRILVAVDGSLSSHHAIEAVRRFEPSLPVTVVHAIDPSQWLYPVAGPEFALSSFVAHFEQEGRMRGTRIVGEAVAMLRGRDSEPCRKIEIGNPADVLLQVAETEGAGLIVLGARGLGTIGEAILGSVSHRVVEHASCPVLVVQNPLGELKHAILGIEGTGDEENAVAFLGKHPFPEAMRVTVLHAIPGFESMSITKLADCQRWVECARKSGTHMVERVASEVRRCGYDAETKVVWGAPVEMLVRAVSQAHADIILIGSHGRHGLSRFLLGSVSHSLLHSARVPILVVR